MFSSVSGLGRLFNSASSSISSHSSQTQRHYDSVTEESVTYDLLYPEADTLQEGRHHAYPIKHGDPGSVAAAAQSADDRGGLDIHPSRDVRILVGQKINDINRVLFDTLPPILYSTIRTSSAKPSDSDEQLKENRFVGGLGGSSRMQKARTAPHSQEASLSQTGSSVFTSSSPPLPTGEQGGLSGNSNFRGLTRPSTSEGESLQTKVAREEREERDDILSCMFGASGFLSTASTKIHVKPYSSLSRSSSRPTSPEAMSPAIARGLEPHRTTLARSTTAENLSTVMKPSGPSENQVSRRNSTYVLITKLFSIDLKDDELGHEFHEAQNAIPEEKETKPAKADTTKHNSSNKQVRTPIFAVAIVLYIPYLAHTAPDSVQSPWKSAFGSSESIVEISQHTGAANDFDDRVSRALDRLPTLIRILASFEIVARATLKPMLIAQYAPSETFPRRSLQFEPSALQSCKDVQVAANLSRTRTALALRIRPVLTGQDRWPIWKGLARGISKTGASQDQPTFLPGLLTGFLRVHSEWLNLLAPRWYRRQYQKQRLNRRDEVDAIPSRTVIVGLDKMAARRLVFLLAIFFPSNYTTIPQQRRKSFEVYDSTPPYPSNPSRQDSLRRTATSKTPHPAPDGFSRAVQTEVDRHGRIISTHNRKASDAASIRSLALPATSISTRKSSTTTAATVLPSPQQAIPLFSGVSPEKAISISADFRPGSSGSLAARSLQRTLSRSESNERSDSSTNSQGRDRWGSTRSGFWSSRRGSSTENSEVMASSGEGLGISGLSQSKASSGSMNKLNKMVEEANTHGTLTISDSPRSRRTMTAIPKTSPPRLIPRSSPLDRSPLALSVDEKDGVINVQYSPSPSQASLPLSLFSPPRTVTSQGSLSAFCPYSIQHPSNFSAPPISQSNSPVSVAGWLHTYHPDFALQALRPYPALKEEIRHSMRSSPSFSPSPSAPPINHSSFTPITKTLLVDLSSSTLTLLTLHRRNPSSPKPITNALLHRTPDPNEEYFTEQVLSDIDPDPVLAEAIDRVIAKKGSTSSKHSSRAGSRASSPPPSPSIQAKEGPRHGQGKPLMVGAGQAVRGIGRLRDEMPKSADTKKIILGALAGVARDVATELDEEGEEEKGRGVGVMNSHVYPHASPRTGTAVAKTERRSRDEGVIKIRDSSEGREKDDGNTLRESVRAWMCGVRTAAAFASASNGTPAAAAAARTAVGSAR